MNLLIKNCVTDNFCEMGAGTEKEKFSLGHAHKTQSKNPINYFIMTKQIICSSLLQILPYLPYLQLVWF